ncbi:hypothetical protein [Erysipelothrix rhusiopathiae]|uniref:hypothetical protein n=1 Tax=Erysipelothrix rhusiopathiae TaxID=1648 RepID=UPI000F42F263|nr:hypothetical protein [Erysipelothrix rhusiopathiae]AYV34006.1 hypothetical protein EEY85_01245 [Erysipelothrix rhusiopathiae]
MNFFFNYTLPLFILLTILGFPVYFLSKRIHFKKRSRPNRFNQPSYAARPHRLNLTIMGAYILISCIFIIFTFYLENWPRAIEPKTRCQEPVLTFTDPSGYLDAKPEYALCFDEHSQLIFEDPNTAFDSFIEEHRFDLYKVHLKFKRFTPINRKTYRNYANLDINNELEAPHAQFFKIFNQSVYPNTQGQTLRFIPLNVDAIEFSETYKKPDGDIERTEKHQEFAIISVSLDLQSDDPIIDFRNAFTLISDDTTTYLSPRLVLNKNNERMDLKSRNNQATLIFNVDQDTPYNLIFATEHTIPQKEVIRKP